MVGRGVGVDAQGRLVTPRGAVVGACLGRVERVGECARPAAVPARRVVRAAEAEPDNLSQERRARCGAEPPVLRVAGLWEQRPRLWARPGEEPVAAGGEAWHVVRHRLLPGAPRARERERVPPQPPMRPRLQSDQVGVEVVAAVSEGDACSQQVRDVHRPGPARPVLATRERDEARVSTDVWDCMARLCVRKRVRATGGSVWRGCVRKRGRARGHCPARRTRRRALVASSSPAMTPGRRHAHTAQPTAQLRSGRW